MVLKLKRIRSTKRSNKTKVKSTASKTAEAGRAVERRDEQNGKLTEESGREDIDSVLGPLFSCWCMDAAANDVDGIADILGKEVPGVNEIDKVSKKRVKKEAKKKAKEAARRKVEAEQNEANTAVVQNEFKMRAAAHKQAEKDAMKAARKAAKEEAKKVALMKTIPLPLLQTEGNDKNQVETSSPPQEDESNIEKLLKQLQEEQKELKDVDKKRADVERKILDTITMIKAAATGTEIDSIQEDESLREILSWDDHYDDGTASETSSFIRAEEERGFMGMFL
eukprot:scaffold12336_cov191-Skeletonema_menzelii.AAC.5